MVKKLSPGTPLGINRGQCLLSFDPLAVRKIGVAKMGEQLPVEFESGVFVSILLVVEKLALETN